VRELRQVDVLLNKLPQLDSMLGQDICDVRTSGCLSFVLIILDAVGQPQVSLGIDLC